MEVNALATLRLALLARSREKPYIAFSSGQIYAPAEGAASEYAPTYPADRATYYLASKLTGELYVEHMRRGASWPAHVLRVGSCYGPGMPAGSVVARFVGRAIEGQPLEVHDGGRAASDLVYVDDVVAMTLHALKGGPPGVYNCGTGRATTTLELAQAVADVWSDRAPRVDVKPPQATPPLSFRPLAIEKARASWGYRPRSIHEGLTAWRGAIAGEAQTVSESQ
jgi:UDP-glucose 4-epimerase